MQDVPTQLEDALKALTEYQMYYQMQQESNVVSHITRDT